MQVFISNHKSTESAIKNLEVQIGQLVKQLAKKSTRNFMANTENPKEECKVVLTRSKRNEILEKVEKVEGEEEDMSDEEGENKRREEAADNK